MPVGDVVQLIGAVTGTVGAIGLIVTPIVVAMINTGAKRKAAEKVEQGQPVAPDHLGTLIDDLVAERDWQRRRAEKAEAQLVKANLTLAANDLPTY